MSLKKLVIKNTWYITCIFLGFNICLNFIMVGIAQKIEAIIYALETLQHKEFIGMATYVALLCILYIVFNFSYYFFYQCTEKKARKLAVECCYSHYLSKDLNFFSGNGTGDITYSITTLAAEVGSYYATFWQMLFVSAATLSILFAAIASYNLLFAFCILAGVSALIVFTSFLSNRISERTLIKETLNAEINNTMVQSFQGITIIKALRKEAYFSRLYKKGLSEQIYRNDLAKNIWYSLYVAFYDVMVIILPVAVLLAGFLLRERELISIGAVIAIYSLVGLLQEPIRNIADSVTYYKEHTNRIAKLGKITEPVSRPENIPEIKKIDVQVKDLKIDGHTLLKNTGFEIEKGDVISLQGPSGCGKSTLLKMIIGLAKHEGCICHYDGLLQADVSDAALYANIALAEQKPFLFSASIRDNILLGESFHPSLLEEVIRVCALEKMIEQYGLDKEVDWAGGNVSGGEMQRITVARTIIRKPKFLLLDEITASLDAAAAEAIAENIVAFARKYHIAIVAVSHKDEFVRRANKRVILPG